MDHNSTLVTHTKLKTRMGSNRLARQSFGMLKICKDHILFELCLWEKKEEEEERKKKMNKIEFFKFGFFKLVKG